jgi:pSer/pThr/pTyr-binding forkhead associated (FHA) protein
MTGICIAVEPEEGGSEPLRLVFASETVRLGRATASDVCLPAQVVSARHAELRRDGRDWFAVDLGSTNGTRLNGTPLAPHVPALVRDGDSLEIPGFRLAVELDVAVDPGTAASTAILGRRLVREVLARLHPRASMPRLIVTAGPDAGRSASLEAVGAEVRIGRAEHCELRLCDALASREQALVRRDLSGLVLEALSPRNPTRVGGTPALEPRPLRDRDEIALGNTRISVSDPAEALAAEVAELPDEAWLPPPAPPSRAPAAEARRRRALSWEWVAAALGLAAVGGGAYLIYVLLAD